MLLHMESHLQSIYNDWFIAAILEIEKQYGPLSRLLDILGGMSILMQ
jgi:hypothetical protein